MASEYEFKTDVYGEVYDLLEVAKKAAHPWGAKKLTEELYALFMKEIVEGDMELSSLVVDAQNFTKESDEVRESMDDTVAELQRKGHELLMLKLCMEMNLLHMKQLVRHAARLQGMLTLSYI